MKTLLVRLWKWLTRTPARASHPEPTPVLLPEPMQGPPELRPEASRARELFLRWLHGRPATSPLDVLAIAVLYQAACKKNDPHFWLSPFTDQDARDALEALWDQHVNGKHSEPGELP
jgi:hypothetical protein